ncbi:MAG: oligosaccharide flippase family protein [Candidatus Sericytochromatia bacterium]|nr:oligosaccharide flippase family protein [Candidatus Sericytochromatia bacterium]
MLLKLLNSTSLKANVIANFVGNGWAALLGFIFIPTYLKYIGPEGYGLIGIFASLQVLLSLLDSGMSTTLNREMSRLSAFSSTEQKMRNIVKTLGSVYWLIALFAGFVGLILSPLLAKYWVNPNTLSVQTITYVFCLLSVTVVFQFPTGLYSGGLLGLQRQIILNILRITFATLKNLGAVIILLFISKSLLIFFSWYLFISIIQAFTYKYTLWFYLPKTSQRTFFDKQELKNIWRFAAGLTVIGLTGILLTQVDTIILSKILPLEQFGYYTFAFTLGSISYMIVGPISQSYFPRFSILLAEEKFEELTRIYHQGCQLVTLLVVPFALFLTFFSKEIIFIWTRDHHIVENTWKITSVVSLAVAIHCLMYLPYMLCLTYSHTKLALYTNTILLIVLIPSTIYAAINFGGLGGAVCWLIITIVYLCINPILVHKLFLKGEVLKWYWNDTLKPILGCIIILVFFRFFLLANQFDTYITGCILFFIGMASFFATYFSSQELKIKGFKKL